MASSFRSAIGFLADIGVYDVVLPFVLVFVIVFAILEKTRVFGVYTMPDGKEYAKKNLDSMVAFVISFFVIASSQLVQAITKVSSNMVILLMASVLFLLLVGSFQKETKEGVYLTGGYKAAFMGIIFVGLAAIFLDAFTVDGKKTWLEQILEWVSSVSSSTTVATVILMGVVFVVLFLITRDSSTSSHGEDKH